MTSFQKFPGLSGALVRQIRLSSFLAILTFSVVQPLLPLKALALPTRVCNSAIASNAEISREQLNWLQNQPQLDLRIGLKGTSQETIQARIGTPYCWLLQRNQYIPEAFYPFCFDPEHGFIVQYQINPTTKRYEMSGFDFADMP